MGATRTRTTAALCGLLWLAGPAAAGDLPPLPPAAKPPAAAGDRLPPLPPVAKPPAAADDLPPLPPAAKPPAAKPPAAVAVKEPADARTERPAGDGPTPAEVAALRAETTARIARLPKPGDKDATAAGKALREVLDERLRWLDEWEKAVKDRAAAENPEPSPEKQASEWKAELERAATTLNQAAKDPASLLPVVFRNLPDSVTDAARVEMQEAIDSAQKELNDWSAKLELARANPSKKDGSALASLRTERDKTFRRLASLKAESSGLETARSRANTAEAKDLARETFLNSQWESYVEAERFRGLETKIGLETRRADLVGLNVRRLEAHVQLGRKTLDGMKGRFRDLATRRENDLQRASVREQSRAAVSADPLEKYRAKRTAELLELEARVLKSENALTTDPPPSLDEQQAKALHAETDFANVKKLLDDGKVSHLDALRLNNDFRRIGVERAAVVKKELAVAAGRLAAAENALSAVEIELVNDSRDDRAELDNLLDTLPKPRHGRAVALFEELERKHMTLLNRFRDALQKLAGRADQTHDQILKRLRVLDDHFGFIRTHMFWVQDEEPVGPRTLAQAQRELRQLGRAGLTIAGLSVDRKSWGRVSPEFLVAAFGLAVLPWPFHRARGALRAAVKRRPAAPPPPV